MREALPLFAGAPQQHDARENGRAPQTKVVGAMENQRDVPDVRALLKAHGPTILFQAIAAACVETAREAPEDVEFWECAAIAAHNAVASLLGDEGDEEDFEDGDEGNEDEGDVEAMEEPEHMSAAPEASSSAASEAPSVRCPQSSESEPPGNVSAQTQEDEMTKEDQLGKRPPLATSWGLRFRSEATEGKWIVVRKRENDRYDSSEWPIRSCSLAAITRDFPTLEGEIAVQYIHTDENGNRRPVGRSRIVPVRAAAAASQAEKPATASPRKRTPLFAVPPPETPATSEPTPSSPATIGGGASSFQEWVQWQEMQRQAREEERERRRAEREEEREERRQERQEQLERERMNHELELKKMELNARAHRAGVAAGLDPEAIQRIVREELRAEREQIGQTVSTQVQQAMDALADDDDDDDTKTPAPQDTATAVINALRETLAPLVPLVLAKLQPTPPEAHASMSLPREGASHAAE